MTSNRVVLRAARLFDGDHMVTPAVVHVADGRVLTVGSTTSEPGEVVDLGDVTLMPGLVDAHQHLCFDGAGTLEQQVTGLSNEALGERAFAAARRALLGGITTIRDVGDRGFVTLDLRNVPDLPTILAAGPPITVAGGHCWYLGGECDDDSALRSAVAERADRGCDLVKVMVTGGLRTPTYPMWKSQFDRRALHLIVDHAHRRGLPVAAHCHGTDGIRDALVAGIDTIEHCTFFNSQGQCDPDAKTIKELGEAGAAVCFDVGYQPGSQVPPVVRRNEQTLREIRRRVSDAGATVAAGSDAGVSEAKPHDVLRYTLDELHRSGFDSVDALRAITSTAATVIGVAERKGRIAPGKDADIIAIAGNPTLEGSTELLVNAVWLGGTRIR